MNISKGIKMCHNKHFTGLRKSEEFLLQMLKLGGREVVEGRGCSRLKESGSPLRTFRFGVVK